MTRERHNAPVAPRAKFSLPTPAHFWRQVWPHEYVFGFFLLLTWTRLVWRAGPFNYSALIFGGYGLMSLAVIAWANAQPTTFRYRTRLLFYPVLMGLSFYTLPRAVAVLAVPNADPLLAGWDRALCHALGGMGSWSGNTFLTDLMMLAYLFFFFYLIMGPAFYFFRDLSRFRQCFVGLFTVYGLGFIGYTIFPAVGPHHFEIFAKPLAAGWLTTMVGPVIDGGSNGVDVFPSIHVAVSLYLLAFDGRYYHRRFWLFVTPCAILWLSTFYLRYHYFVDVFAGIGIAAIGFWVATSFENAKRRAVSVPWELQPGIRLTFPQATFVWNAIKSGRKESRAPKREEPAVAMSIQSAGREID